MPYPDAISYLYGLQKHGIKLGLDKTRSILALFDNPHHAFPMVHVAGTNGKGSVCAMTASILRALGYSVGLYTSPHLLSFTERILVDGKPISEDEVSGLTGEIRTVLNNRKDIPQPTFFEFVTTLAFGYFRRKNVGIAVIETGMGGRLDATNVISPLVTAITKIGTDHTMYLGQTIREIAGEKAGIIKEAIPVVSSPQCHEADSVIGQTAVHLNAPLYRSGIQFRSAGGFSGPEGVSFIYEDDNRTIPGLCVPLQGKHQIENALTAVKTAIIAAGRMSSSNTDVPMFSSDRMTDGIRAGLSSVQWPGRMEIVRPEPLTLIDGSHNPDAAATLALSCRSHYPGREIILVAGMMGDKDIPGVLRHLVPLAAEAIFCAPATDRAAPPDMLAETARELGCSTVRTAGSVQSAIAIAESLCRMHRENSSGQNPLILITGSFYTLGEALECMGRKSVLGNLREQ